MQLGPDAKSETRRIDGRHVEGPNPDRPQNLERKAKAEGTTRNAADQVPLSDGEIERRTGLCLEELDKLLVADVAPFHFAADDPAGLIVPDRAVGTDTWVGAAGVRWFKAAFPAR